MSSAQHSRSASGNSSFDALEAGQWAGGLKLRPRPSCNDLQQLLGGGSPAEARPLVEKVKPIGGSAASSCHSSPRAVAQLARGSWRRGLAVLLALVLCVSLLGTQRRQIHRGLQNVAAGVYYGLDPNMMGRSGTRHPSPQCCRDEACVPPPGARVAVVTYLRSDSYAPLLQQLECTVRRSNPGLELALMHVPGELSSETLALARRLNVTLLPVELLDFPNTFEPKYGRNWVKVRALGLTQYHSVLLVDSDVAITGAVDSLFSMPVEYAAVWDQSKWLNRYRTSVTKINGGVMLVRPCAAVEAHMVDLVLRSYTKLRFVHGKAEQDFFGWYYRYTGATLGLHWNCQVGQCLVGNVTEGGMPPKILHFTHNKPFNGPQPGVLGHNFLCTTDELNRRSLLGGVATGQPAAAQQQPQGSSSSPSGN